MASPGSRDRLQRQRGQQGLNTITQPSPLHPSGRLKPREGVLRSLSSQGGSPATVQPALSLTVPQVTPSLALRNACCLPGPGVTQGVHPGLLSCEGSTREGPTA